MCKMRETEAQKDPPLPPGLCRLQWNIAGEARTR